MQGSTIADMKMYRCIKREWNGFCLKMGAYPFNWPILGKWWLNHRVTHGVPYFSDTPRMNSRHRLALHERWSCPVFSAAGKWVMSIADMKLKVGGKAWFAKHFWRRSLPQCCNKGMLYTWGTAFLLEGIYHRLDWKKWKARFEQWHLAIECSKLPSQDLGREKQRS